MVAPAFVVFSLFTFPAVPLALAIQTPQKDSDTDSSKEQDDSAAPSNATASDAIRYTVMVVCAAILFLGVGAEIGYGTWIATYSLDKLGVSEVAAAYLSSSYYGGFLFGRLAAVPLSTQLSPLQLLYISYAGGTLALLPLVPGVLEAVGIELQQTATHFDGAADAGSAANGSGFVSPVELSVGVSVGLGIFIAPVFAACMSVSTVAGLPMTSAMMSFQVSGAVLGEMLVTVIIGARISEDVDEFATLNLAVMASGLLLCLLLSAVLARLPASEHALAAASSRSRKEQEEEAAEREALIGQ